MADLPYVISFGINAFRQARKNPVANGIVLKSKELTYGRRTTAIVAKASSAIAVLL